MWKKLYFFKYLFNHRNVKIGDLVFDTGRFLASEKKFNTVGDVRPPSRLFQNFEKRIYFITLKLSQAVLHSLRISICQPCVHNTWKCHCNVIITSRSSQKSSFLTFFFIFQLYKTKLYDWFNSAFDIHLAWFCIHLNYLQLLKKMVKSKMADQRWRLLWRHTTSYDITAKKYVIL